jgi:hypothetical protein
MVDELASTAPNARDCVVQYVYVHSPEDDLLQYPTSRVRAGAGRLATRYLECALVQAASLRFNGADCDLALVTNLSDPILLGQRGSRLLKQLESLGVEIIHASYAHEPRGPISWFHASRYVFDAIAAVASASPPGRCLWLADVDCVWVRPPEVFAALPRTGAIGCIHLGYGIDWDLSGKTRAGFEALRASAGRAGASGAQPNRADGEPSWVGGESSWVDGEPSWVGGELLAGAAGDLLALVDACEELDHELERLDCLLGTEEQLLSLADALGRIRFHDLSGFGARILTGPRHSAVNPPDPCALGFWHLPSEKGLGFRRAASAILAARTRRLRRDLTDPRRAMRRFNVQGSRWTPRRVRDDSWIVANRLRETTLDYLSRVT